MFIKTTDGTPKPYTIGQLCRDYPQTSFPKAIPDEGFPEFDVYKVKLTTAPAMDSKTHRHRQDIQFVDGEWTQVWQVMELPLSQATDNIRGYRDALLSETDWLIVKSYESGEPVPSAWADYRQALRNVPAQEGFPYSVEWPSKPE